MKLRHLPSSLSATLIHSSSFQRNNFIFLSQKATHSSNTSSFTTTIAAIFVSAFTPNSNQLPSNVVNLSRKPSYFNSNSFEFQQPHQNQHQIRRSFTSNTIMSATTKGKKVPPSKPPKKAASKTKKTTTTKAKKPSTKKSTRKKKDDTIPTIPHVADEYIPEWMNKERTKILYEPSNIENCINDDDEDHQCVYYWMQRDVRTEDNWALLFAQHLAQMQNVPLRVLYVLPCPYKADDNGNDDNDDDDNLPPKVCKMQMTKRHGSFLLGGLQIVEKELIEKNVPFDILMSPSHENVGEIVHDFIMGKKDCNNKNVDDDQKDKKASVLICDMNPLRQFRNWVEDQTIPLMKESDVPFYQVDAHNIIPVWFASPKREVGARTLRPKINKLLPDFMTHFPEFEGNSHIKESICPKDNISWSDCQSYLKWDESVPAVSWAKPGKEAAMERFEEFCSSKTEGLKNFDTLRNDPNYAKVCSNLSPWVNHGMVSFQRLALDVRALKKYPNGTASYIEEGIVRRELSDNFVYYSRDNYDELSTAAGWAQDTLQNHTNDEREYLYTLEELEKSQTHDDLWNAAQIQLVSEGHMHGFLRMYWAKKILEWTKSPAVALRTGLYFNDRYALDGNDPNGFTGVGWSVMGIHDMGWKERPIFGKIRFMNYAGCKRKFKVDTFVSRYRNAKVNAIKAEAKAATTSKKTTAKKRKASAL